VRRGDENENSRFSSHISPPSRTSHPDTREALNSREIQKKKNENVH